MEIIIHRKHAVNMTQPERWISAAGGGFVAAAGVRRGGFAGFALTLIGSDLIRRGLTGHSYLYEALGIRTVPRSGASVSVPYELGVRVDRAIIIHRSRFDVFRFWRNLENLARAMEHVESLRQRGNRSRWVVRGPRGRTVQWDAVIHNEIENELISWRSLPGSQVENAGTVLFQDAPGGGTEVKVELQYNPPGGAVGAILAAIWGADPDRQIGEDLERIRNMIETGVPAPVKDQVDEASEESFPASDAPAYNF